MKYGPQSNLMASSSAFETRHLRHFSSQTPGTGSQGSLRRPRSDRPPLWWGGGGGAPSAITAVTSRAIFSTRGRIQGGEVGEVGALTLQVMVESWITGLRYSGGLAKTGSIYQSLPGTPWFTLLPVGWLLYVQLTYWFAYFNPHPHVGLFSPTGNTERRVLSSMRRWSLEVCKTPAFKGFTILQRNSAVQGKDGRFHNYASWKLTWQHAWALPRAVP